MYKASYLMCYNGDVLVLSIGCSFCVENVVRFDDIASFY